MTSRCAQFASTLRAGTARSSRPRTRCASRCVSACAWSVVLPTPMLRKSSQPASTGRSPRSMTYGDAPACRLHRSYSSPKPTPSARPWAWLDANRWAIKALRDEPAAEIDEPEVALKPMTAGSEVVEDYRHVGLTLRRHLVAFLRAD